MEDQIGKFCVDQGGLGERRRRGEMTLWVDESKRVEW